MQASPKWDVDVAIVHQLVMPDLIQNGLVARYAPEIATYKLMTAADGRNALGFNVEGYVMPMFHSQVVLAYNPEVVKSPPNTFDELVAWIKANPKKFGYNGVKGGMSGVAFATGWVYWKAGGDERYTKGPYAKETQAGWPAAIKELKGLPVTLTSGNNDTLDRLNRGEICDGPGVGGHAGRPQEPGPHGPEDPHEADLARFPRPADVPRGPDQRGELGGGAEVR